MRGIVIGVTPDEDRGRANPYLSYSVATGTGQARNLAVVCSGDVIVAVGGEYGALPEIGPALKVGRPVVALKSRDPGGRSSWPPHRRRRWREPSRPPRAPARR